MTRIAIVIPVGPEAHHADYLDEALASVAAQTRKPDLLVIVDDMHGIDLEGRFGHPGHKTELHIDDVVIPAAIYYPPWRLGVGHAFNAGVATALNARGEEACDLALMLGADDKLEPRVLEHLEREYERQGGRDGYYAFTTIYEDGTEQTLPCNNAAVTAGFMRETGGLPIEASSGGMDAALISAMLVHRPNYLIHVTGNEGRFWSRQHANQEGARLGAYHGAMDFIRGVFTETWRPTRWGRYQ